MSIKTQCQSCSRTLSVPSKHAGKKIRCPGCQQGTRVPDPEGAGERVRPSRPAKRRSSPPAQPGPKRRPRRDEEYDPDDIWSRPIHSRGEAIDEDDYDEFGIAPRKRKKDRDEGQGQNSRGRSKPRSAGDGNVMMMAAIGCCVLSLILGVIAIAMKSSNAEVARAIAIAGVLFGGAVAAVGNWIMLSNAHEDGVGMMYRFVPFYAFVYIFTNLDRNGRPFLANVGGVTSCIVCFFGMAGT